ncbi:hypothetical protein MJD09_12325 [bacterium]|nr:hypothetical protein [bacterium]
MRNVSYVSFVSNPNDFTIEYRMHHPFNASSGRHEGDWPTIKVTIDSQDPNDSQIISVSYPFHGLRTVRTQPLPFSQQEAESFWQEVYYEEGETHPARFKYFVIDGTHPVSFSGGRIDEGGVEGWGSHAQYPLLGTWIREMTFAERRY